MSSGLKTSLDQICYLRIGAMSIPEGDSERELALGVCDDLETAHALRAELDELRAENTMLRGRVYLAELALAAIELLEPVTDWDTGIDWYGDCDIDEIVEAWREMTDE